MGELNIGTLYGLLTLNDDLSPALATAGANVDGFSTRVVALGTFIGIVAAEAFGALVRAVYSAIGALGEMVMHGFELAPLVTSFEQLTASIGQSGDEMLNVTRTATRGLITDLDLMAAANRAILLGLPITSSELGILGETALSLGRAMNVGPTAALNDLINGIGRLSPEILDNLGISVRAADAYATYAAQMGISVREMSVAERQLAFYNTVMEASRLRLLELGDVHLTVADQFLRMRNALTNVTDGLGVAIALSPVVGVAFGGIADGMTDAFGANRVQVIQTLIGWVNNFAITLVDAAQIGISAAGYMRQGWALLELVFFSVASVVASVGLAFANLVAGAVEVATHIPGIGSAFGNVAFTARDLANQMTGIQQSFHDQSQEALAAVTGNSAFHQTLDGVSGGLTTMRARMVEAMNTQVTAAEIARVLTTTTDNAATSTRNAATAQGLLTNATQALAPWMFTTSVNTAAFAQAAVAATNEARGLTADGLIPSTSHLERYGMAAVTAGVDTLALAAAQERATTTTTTLGARLQDGFIDVMAAIPSLIQQAFTGGGGLQGALDAIGSLSGQTLATSLLGSWDRESETIENGLFAGMTGMFGAVVGNMIPVVGSLLGPLMGAIGDALHRSGGEDVVRRVGHDLGIAITEELGDAINETAEALFGGSRNAAEVFHLQDLIEAAGGITEDNFTRLLGRLRDVFSMVETGAFNASQAAQVLDQNWQSFVDAALDGTEFLGADMLEIIALHQRFGLQSEAITRFVTEQTTDALGGLQTFLENARISTEAGALSVSAAIGMAFQQLQAHGMGVRQALEAIMPAMDLLDQRLDESGFSDGGFLDPLRNMAAIATDEFRGPLLDAIDGLNQAMIGLHNSGLLSEDMFAGLAGEVSALYAELMAAGTDGEAALRLMQPTLQTIWQMQQRFGYEVDAGTQALLDQAAAAGLVGGQFMDPMLQIVDILAAIADALGATLPDYMRDFGQVGVDTAQDVGQAWSDALGGIAMPEGLDASGYFYDADGDGSNDIWTFGRLPTGSLSDNYWQQLMDGTAGTPGGTLGGSLYSGPPLYTDAEYRAMGQQNGCGVCMNFAEGSITVGDPREFLRAVLRELQRGGDLFSEFRDIACEANA